MTLSVPNVLQKNYTTSAVFSKPVNLSLHCGFGSAMPDSFAPAPLKPADQRKYDKILNSLPAKSVLEFENLRKRGVLTDKKSNDESSTLDNLYKILTTERARRTG